jgi:hypothetical protein
MTTDRQRNIKVDLYRWQTDAFKKKVHTDDDWQTDTTKEEISGS